MRASKALLKRSFGQALHENRPHLVGSGFLTPNITASEYASRRTRLADRLPANSLVISHGNAVQFTSPSVFYPFRQDPNFQYLTGFLEPDACLVMSRNRSGELNELLFVPKKDPLAEQWEGERTGVELVPSIFGVSQSAPFSDLGRALPRLIEDADHIYIDADPSSLSRINPSSAATIRALLAPKSAGVKSLSSILGALRLVKSEAEIDCLRRAAEISAAAYNRAYTLPFESETQLHAFLNFAFLQGGCESEAYLAVVAGGSHALTIHYVRNDDLLRQGDLVLVDAGGRYGGYCADISRTWPVSGKFTEPQRDLYEAVLATNKKCLEECVAGNVTFASLHDLSVKTLRAELANAGLPLSPSQVSEVYPHSIGHNLGVDVHDPSVPRDVPFVSGQVVTVEPGVYVPDDLQYPAHFRGIGIRVEDNVVVGEGTNEVLTFDCGKEIVELEHQR